MPRTTYSLQMLKITFIYLLGISSLLHMQFMLCILIVCIHRQTTKLTCLQHYGITWLPSIKWICFLVVVLYCNNDCTQTQLFFEQLHLQLRVYFPELDYANVFMFFAYLQLPSAYCWNWGFCFSTWCSCKGQLYKSKPVQLPQSVVGCLFVWMQALPL